ncbi:HalOD1 output domain-containing protein [Haloarcula onubensis]|uniref:Halobacterial output domain-containing protein n=1 Tax=Haloarcula onubensis TaxID=2950539 RepID=A0ABU2FPZ1_9EURY|nr:HalOD1 output domain-containing protein [Halomicroarcula sp. S3CR25-11]MDS0282818.1 hypothetical protein [Halomicroarcula sp. S3CR25-11]
MRYVKSDEYGTDTACTVSDRVIRAVADREGVSPLDISTPLFDAIDPDALDRLYGNHGDGVTTVFEYSGYRVTVHGGGRVELGPIAE